MSSYMVKGYVVITADSSSDASILGSKIFSSAVKDHHAVVVGCMQSIEEQAGFDVRALFGWTRGDTDE